MQNRHDPEQNPVRWTANSTLRGENPVQQIRRNYNPPKFPRLIFPDYPRVYDYSALDLDRSTIKLPGLLWQSERRGEKKRNAWIFRLKTSPKGGAIAPAGFPGFREISCGDNEIPVKSPVKPRYVWESASTRMNEPPSRGSMPAFFPGRATIRCLINLPRSER